MTPVHIYDLDGNTPINVYVRGRAPGHILLGVVPQHFGDIEVAFQPADGWTIVALFLNALQVSGNDVESSTTGNELVHRFANVDGGAEAAFLVRRVGNSLDITIHRSDEGDLGLRISFEDARKLIAALQDALKVEQPSSPT